MRRLQKWLNEPVTITNLQGILTCVAAIVLHEVLSWLLRLVLP